MFDWIQWIYEYIKETPLVLIIIACERGLWNRDFVFDLLVPIYYNCGLSKEIKLYFQNE